MQAWGITSLILFTLSYIFHVGNDASLISESRYSWLQWNMKMRYKSSAFRNKFIVSFFNKLGSMDEIRKRSISSST
jgi:hypothetical protein